VESQFQPVEGADEMLDMPLGTLIFRAGLIAPQQLEDALAEGLRSGKRLGEVLLSRDWLSEGDLSRLLAGQKGLPFADLDKIAIDRELAQAMSYDDARTEMALPIVAEFGVPVVAMADPDEAAMERLRAQLGPEVRFVVAAPSVLARRIDEILGGAPAPGIVVAPVTAEQYSPSDRPAEPVLPEIVPEREPAVPEPVALDSSDQEAPATAPDIAAQEIRPIIAEGEVDYPTFSEFQPLPETEIIKGSDEQLPAEVQMGEYGYYDDSSLLEGNAWQAGETGPQAAESAAEIVDLGADQYDAEQPAEEVEAPVQESYPETYTEPAAPDVEERASEQLPEPLEEVAGSSSGEENLLARTPAWMRDEVNVITADVAEGEPELAVSGDETPVEVAPIVEETTEAEAAEPLQPELAEGEPVAAELGAEPPAWASETNEAAEEVTIESAGDVPSEPDAAPEEGSTPESGRGEYALVLRLADGDRIPIGTFENVEEAQEKAAEVVKQFDEIKEGGWPFIGGRFLRPETIVSIDVEQHDSGWGGSNSRGRMFSGDENA
jgi:hypothetical protein